MQFQGFTLVIRQVTNGRYKMHSLVEFGGRYIYSNDHEDPEYNKLCSDHIDSTIRTYFTKILTMFASFIYALIFILYLYFRHGIRSTTTELKFPFIAEDSDAEFIANLIYQYVIAVIGFLGFIGLEAMMSLFNDTASISPKLAEYEFGRLDKMVENGRLSEPRIQFALIRIIKRALDTDKYVFTVFNLCFHFMY